jgi:DNA repair protein radc
MLCSFHEELKLLSDAELLAYFFGSRALALLKKHKGLYGVFDPDNLADQRYRKLFIAREILVRAFRESLIDRDCCNDPTKVKDYLRLHFAGKQAEAFVAVWLDAQNRVLAIDELFRGTLTQTSVYPREVAKRALERNAGGVIFSHNHPSSGATEPSRADCILTAELKQTLLLIDVKVLDHIVVADGVPPLSFAERGIL